ncbi:MAG: fumarylacetoacetate hydrolase family protein [Planctomycetes bacterium]|nr:fumarylacetoacetate hydrolase family protein [Planctomycetota bacterium]
MKLYQTPSSLIVEHANAWYRLPAAETWDTLLTQDDPFTHVSLLLALLKPAALDIAKENLAAPIGSQEVWAAGVTYFRSRDARMEEAKKAGGGSFYDRVYSADRPELFYKASPHRVAAPGGTVRIRSDSKWNVPEPEFTLVINSRGRIVGYTIGNDMSSRDIEGENPLYLPQAKVYARSCGLGPCVLLTNDPLAPETPIQLTITRGGKPAFQGATTLSQMKRKPAELADWLFRDNTFPHGCFLLTGTGVIPPDAFTLDHADHIAITVPPIGTLNHTVE